MGMVLQGRLIGVLGGMGPLATAGFQAKLATCEAFACDQDHPPFIAYANPQVPDRSTAILGRGPSPLPALVEGLRFLERNGAQAIVIPCNTAHYWLDEMAQSVDVPILSILDAVLLAIRQIEPQPRRVGVMGTSGFLASRLYQDKLARAGLEIVEPDAACIRDLIDPCIRAVKASDLETARTLGLAATATLVAHGGQCVVLGCTELPVVLSEPAVEGVPLIDSSTALARLALAWVRSGHLPSDMLSPPAGIRADGE